MDSKHDTRVPPDETALSKLLRRLEVDNIAWMTALMYTIIFGPGETTAIENRLKKNIEEIAGVFEQFYGMEAVERMQKNMLEYLEHFKPLVEAYRDRNIPAIERHRNALLDTADALADALSGINPEWDKAPMQTMLYELIRRNEEEIVRIIERDYERSIAAHDELQELMYRIADELAYGMARRFDGGETLQTQQI